MNHEKNFFLNIEFFYKVDKVGLSRISDTRDLCRRLNYQIYCKSEIHRSQRLLNNPTMEKTRIAIILFACGVRHWSNTVVT